MITQTYKLPGVGNIINEIKSVAKQINVLYISIKIKYLLNLLTPKNFDFFVTFAQNLTGKNISDFINQILTDH